MDVFTTRRSPSPYARDEQTNTWARDGNLRNGDGYSGHRRSPVDRRPRRRSRSPVDSYQPGRLGRDDYHGPRRDDSYRRRSPPPAQAHIDRYVPGQDPPAPVTNPLPNPLTFDSQVAFNYFADWWRKEQEVKADKERQKLGVRRPPDRLKGEKEAREEREKEKEQIQAAYDEYKQKLHAQMARMFVQQHKLDEWFKERYEPEVRDPLRERQAGHRRENFAQWQSDLEQGVFDEFTLEGIYKNDSNGAGGVVDKEEGETMAAAEVLGVGDLVPSKGADLRDEAAQQPALLIKTIAPHVSRDKLEAFCKEHLGESDGGFRWLSLSDPNPMKKYHRIGWIMLNPGGDVQVEVQRVVERNDGREEEGEGDEEENTEVTETELVTQSASDKALSEINGKSIADETRGDFTCHVGVHVPPTMSRKKALWDLFSAPERIERDLQLALRLVAKLEQEVGEDVNGAQRIDERVAELRSRGDLQPVRANGSGKPPKDEDGEMEEGEEDGMEEGEEGVWDDERDDEDMLVKKKRLDLVVEYLRRVFNFCLFCVFESDSVHELTRKCPGGHLRRPRASLTSSAKVAAKASANGEAFPFSREEQAKEDQEEGEESPDVKRGRFDRNKKTKNQLQRAFNWVKTYEDKVYQIIEPDSVDLKKIGGRPIEEGLEDELKKFVKQEDEAKFRCKVPNCTKLFKGDAFWRKHVEKRHTEWLEGLRKDLELINVYVLDPAHIAPAMPAGPNATGHFGMPHGAQGFSQGGIMGHQGAQRGFSLGAMPNPFYPHIPTPNGMPMPGAGYPPGFSSYPVGMPAPFPGAQAYGLDPAAGGVGPMRRGPKYNNRQNPYDRNANNRNVRWNKAAMPVGLNGMIPRGMGGAGGMPAGAMNAARFPDAAVMDVGTRQAVQGRSLKSYEDLDAVGGPTGAGGAGDNGGEGLDY